MPGHRIPRTIIAIHAIATIGVAFWLVMAVRALLDGAGDAAVVVALAIVLGGAHVAVSAWTSRRSGRAVAAMVFILVGDALLTLLVDWRAIVLVGATIVLLLLARTPSARAWFRSAPRGVASQS